MDNPVMDQQTTAQSAGAPLAPRLTLRRVIRDAARHFFDLESGWLRTVRDLTLAPGPSIARYIQGHRNTYVNPFTYLVLGTALSYVVQKLVGFQEKMLETAETNVLESPLQMEFVNRFTELIMQNTLYVSIGVLLPAALLFLLLFRSSGYNFAESFVFVLYAGGQTTILGTLIVPLYMLLPPSSLLQGVVSVSYGLLYMVWAARGFFRGHFLWVAIKAGFGYLIAYVVFMIVMVAAVAAYVIHVMMPTASGVDWDLVAAAEYGAEPVVEKLLAEGADPNATLGTTALHVAAGDGNLEIVEMLMDAGADPDLSDFHGRVPLLMAITERQTEVASRLTQVTDPHARSSDGMSLLMAALRAENAEVARWALDSGIDVNAVREGKRYATALMIAVRNDDAEMVRKLLELGADPDVVNRDGETALNLAERGPVRDLLREVTTLPQSKTDAAAPADPSRE